MTAHRPPAVWKAPRALSLFVGFVGVLGSIACNKPGVSGVVLPSAAERSGLPWQFVEVRLLRGHLPDDLQQLAKRIRDKAFAEARQEVLGNAEAAVDEQAAAYQRARAALGENDPPEGEEPASIRGCLPAAEAQLLAARRDYQRAVAQLAPRLAALGLDSSQPDRALEQLQKMLEAKVEAEARRLRDDYVRNQLVQHSALLLATSSSMDRLCWRVTNKQDVAVRFRGASVVYNGQPLPDSVAQQIWILPRADVALHVPNQGKDSDVLMPGAEFEACFYSRGKLVSADVLTTYGLPNAPGRSGDWEVRWQQIDLVGRGAAAMAPSTGARHEPAPLMEIFAERLRGTRSDGEEGRLMAALNDAPASRHVKDSEAGLLACHRAVELEKRYAELRRTVAAIEAQKADAFAVAVRVQPIVQRILNDPDRVQRWVDDAQAFIKAATLGTILPDLGATYTFDNLTPGSYTVLARSGLEAKQPKVWLLPVQVDGHVTQDLEMALARNKTMRATLEQLVLERMGLKHPAG